MKPVSPAWEGVAPLGQWWSSGSWNTSCLWIWGAPQVTEVHPGTPSHLTLPWRQGLSGALNVPSLPYTPCSPPPRAAWPLEDSGGCVCENTMCPLVCGTWLCGRSLADPPVPCGVFLTEGPVLFCSPVGFLRRTLSGSLPWHCGRSVCVFSHQLGIFLENCFLIQVFQLACFFF